MNFKSFDFIFSNPPYNGSVDIKILSEVVNCSKQLLIVHPATWILDRKMKNKLFLSFRKQVNNKLRSVNVFNGNPIFDIQLNIPVVVTHIDNEYHGSCDTTILSDNFNTDNIYDITKFGESWDSIVSDFSNKILKWTEDNKSLLSEKTTVINEDKFNCQLSSIIGSTSNTSERYDEKLYVLVLKDIKDNVGIRKDDLSTYSFDTESEMINFLNYCKTDFARFCLALYKNTICIHRGELLAVPYLWFTEEWTDTKLYEYFVIDKITQKYIRNFIN